MKGIIYKYTSPNGKIYIGQTLNESRRRKEFLNLKNKYGGLKIYNARKKYKPENFKYEILFEKEYNDISIANNELNELEEKYIKEVNSIKNGYNISIGGESIRSVMVDEECKKRMINSLKKHYKDGTLINPFKEHKHTEETKKILSEKALGRKSPFKNRKHSKETIEKMKMKHNNQFGVNNPFYGKKHTDETKKIISEKNSKSVVQIDKNTNEIINVFKSGKDAGEYFGRPNGNSDILNVCKGKVKNRNGHKIHILTAFGFKWKYLKDIEGSTTIEEDGKIYYNP